MSKGFKRPAVKTRVFNIELKHRDPEDKTGEDEVLIATEQLEVPCLNNVGWEERWAVTTVWNSFSQPHMKEQGINQAFVFTERSDGGFGRLVIRLETNLFHDEPAEKMEVIEGDSFEHWLNQVRKRFKELYGCDFDEWQKSRKVEQEAECIR